MKKLKSIPIIMILLTALVACSASPASQARSELDQGNYESAVEIALTITDEVSQADVLEEICRKQLEQDDMQGAVQTALNITDEAQKGSLLEKIMLKEMNAQDVFDYATLGIEDLSSYASSFSSEVASALSTSALSFLSSSDQEMTFEFPTPNTNDPDFKAAVESGDKVRSIFTAYNEVFTSDVVDQLNDSGKELNTRYSTICNNITTLLSSAGIQGYLYSSDVMGSSMGASAPSVSPKQLLNDTERFTLDYNKAVEKYESNTADKEA